MIIVQKSDIIKNNTQKKAAQFILTGCLIKEEDPILIWRVKFFHETSSNTK